MPLEILIALVVGGIAGIAVLTHLFGFSRSRTFEDDASARAAFAREFPDIPIREVHLSADLRAALLQTGAGPALVWAMGADSCARLLSEIRAEEAKHGLVLRLPDVTAPQVRLTLTPEERPLWQTLTGAAP